MTTPIEPRRRSPAFHILEPNPLLGNRTLAILNPEFCRSLCELIEGTELKPDEKHLYAFAKRMRAHYFKMGQMYQEAGDGALTEGVDSPVLTA